MDKNGESLVVDDSTELIVDFRAGLEQIQDLLVLHLRDETHTNLTSQSGCLLVDDLLAARLLPLFSGYAELRWASLKHQRVGSLEARRLIGATELNVASHDFGFLATEFTPHIS